MPLMLLLVLLLAGTMLGVVRRLLLAVSATARRANSVVRRRLGDAAHRVRLDEVIGTGVVCTAPLDGGGDGDVVVFHAVAACAGDGRFDRRQ